MSELLVGKRSIHAKQVGPGHGAAFTVQTGDMVQIMTVEGKQVADFVAFNASNPEEFLSVSITRGKNSNMMLSTGMSLYSSARDPMFTLVEDLVGRHDLLYACCDAKRYAEYPDLGERTGCREALSTALAEIGVNVSTIPDPVNWFMYIGLLPEGGLEARESLAERNDYVLLKAETDAVFAVSACPQDQTPINGGTPTDILIRVFR